MVVTTDSAHTSSFEFFFELRIVNMKFEVIFLKPSNATYENSQFTLLTALLSCSEVSTEVSMFD